MLMVQNLLQLTGMLPNRNLFNRKSGSYLVIVQEKIFHDLYSGPGQLANKKKISLYYLNLAGSLTEGRHPEPIANGIFIRSILHALI
jgi:hypothetical protein